LGAGFLEKVYGGADPFVEIAAGRSYFRYEDLVRLADLLKGLR
jgi:hypothetical protein